MKKKQTIEPGDLCILSNFPEQGEKGNELWNNKSDKIREREIGSLVLVSSECPTRGQVKGIACVQFNHIEPADVPSENIWWFNTSQLTLLEKGFGLE